METDGIPPMEPLAPIVDRLRELAAEELPAPRSCRVRLWDDGTFEAEAYHSMGKNGIQRVRYERSTGEIVWELGRTDGWTSRSLGNGERIIEPVVDETDVRVLDRVEPPYGGESE